MIRAHSQTNRQHSGRSMAGLTFYWGQWHQIYLDTFMDETSKNLTWVSYLLIYFNFLNMQTLPQLNTHGYEI